MINEAVRHYILQGISATPVVLTHLLQDTNRQIWDRRPDPERFTLREAVAHLADWESVWLARLGKVIKLDRPILPDLDTDQMAKEHNYSQADLQASLKTFQEGRKKILQLLEKLELGQWSRTGNHTSRGTLSIQDLAVIILGHDNYHLAQVAEWTDADRVKSSLTS